MFNIYKPAIQGLALIGLLIASSSFANEDIVRDDLITESRDTTPWTVCDSDSTGIDISLLDAGGCAYRTTPAIPGTTYTMTCGVSVVKFASITLAFLDPTDTFTLATQSTEIFEDGQGAHSVTLQAPPNTGLAAIGIYGEPGSGFQDCVLVDSSPVPEPTKGSISGITWFDDNGDSLFSPSEPPVHGTPVSLNLNGAVIGQTVTGHDGSYYFGHLDVGVCYTVTFDTADPTLMLGAVGGDNDANANGTTSDICLTEAAADVTRVDAPFVAIPPAAPPADYAVCGTSWQDRNSDGIFNNNDAPIANVSARLFDGNGRQVSSVNTDQHGNYSFGSLLAGDYRVEFTTPDGHEPTVASATPESGSSYINAEGSTVLFAIPGSNADASAACTIENVNAGYTELPVALEPTIAKDDSAQNIVGEDFEVAFLDNDMACGGGVSEVDLHGHNVPGMVVYNSTTQTIEISNTTAPGNFSIEYGIRGLCGSYDTATIFITLIEVIPPAPPAAPDAPFCRAETRGNPVNGGFDIFSSTEFGFASSYNLFDINKELVATVFSDDFTHTFQVGSNVDPRITPADWVGNFEIEWNGAAYGFDQTSIYYATAIENGVESEIAECVRTLISPIALDVENEGRVERIVGNYSVDVDGDGIKEAISQWFGPSAGILVTANASGQIDGSHMFGNVPGVYEDGFAELATLDTNNDGQISGKELNSLAIWFDRNSDTIVDDSELTTLESHDIASLAVDHYKFFARARKHDGSSILMEDVWLPMSPLASIVE